MPSAIDTAQTHSRPICGNSWEDGSRLKWIAVMKRIVAISSFFLLSLGAANAQTRDETVAFVILGVEAGDRFDFPLKGQTATVQSVKREGAAIDVAIAGDKPHVIHIAEQPQCVFEIFMDNRDGKVRIDFTKATGLAPHKLAFTTALALEGKDVELDVDKPGDFATLGVLRLGDWDGVNERHRQVAEAMRSRYCPGKAE
jgi:hypothetical protein